MIEDFKANYVELFYKWSKAWLGLFKLILWALDLRRSDCGYVCSVQTRIYEIKHFPKLTFIAVLSLGFTRCFRRLLITYKQIIKYYWLPITHDFQFNCQLHYSCILEMETFISKKSGCAYRPFKLNFILHSNLRNFTMLCYMNHFLQAEIRYLNCINTIINFNIHTISSPPALRL